MICCSYGSWESFWNLYSIFSFMRNGEGFCLFWGFFLNFTFFPFKPLSQIKLHTIHRWQETLEGAVCWVEQRPRALWVSLPSLSLALAHSWLRMSHLPTPHSKVCHALANQKYHGFAQEGFPGSRLCSGISARDHRGCTKADLLPGRELWALGPTTSQAALA